jgi:DnaK suppressor protein
MGLLYGLAGAWQRPRPHINFGKSYFSAESVPAASQRLRFYHQLLQSFIRLRQPPLPGKGVTSLSTECVSSAAHPNNPAFDSAGPPGLALNPMVDVDKFRILLEAERARKMSLLPALREDINSANAARQNSNVDDEHDPEGATIAFELSQASALMQQSSAALAEVEAALLRIADGGYGRCGICGAPIAEGRLEARPWTPYCIDHAGGKNGRSA